MGRNLRFALLAVVLTTLVASACGGSGGKRTALPSQTALAGATPGTVASSPTPRPLVPTVTPRATRTPPGSVEDEAAITAVIDQAMGAIRARDLAGFRALFVSGAPVEDAELNSLFTCMAETTRIQEAPGIQFLSDLARATVKFQRASNGQTTEMQGIWQFQKQAGGNWGLYIPPFCPQ